MRKFLIQCLTATFFVFGMMWCISKITKLELFNAFDPISQALSDFELTDYAFSNLREDPLVDERIVLVNIGNLTRGQIAQQISIVSQYKPRVIGIDSFFDCEGGLRDSINCPALLDTMGNLMLSNAIQEAGNVVLVSKLFQSHKLRALNAIDEYDSTEFSDPAFQNAATYGYANLPTGARYQEDVKICRSFFPKISVNGKYQHAFAVQMALKYDSAKTMRLLQRENFEEIINYRGNIDLQDVKIKSLREQDLGTTRYPVYFSALDVEQPFRGEFVPELFRDKIVIFGFLGNYFGDPSWSDKFFTPLNNKVAGRANPDMFGLVVHANILATILNEDYVDELSEWMKYLMAFIFCFANISIFYVINKKYPLWFDSVSLLIQVLQIVLLMAFTIELFALSSFKLDLTLTLATIAAVGPSFEFYFNVLSPALSRLWLKTGAKFTNKPFEVFIPKKD
jgi:CHASE2 domain-containing sensor protein